MLSKAMAHASIFLQIFNLSKDTKFLPKLKFPSEGHTETAVLQLGSWDTGYNQSSKRGSGKQLLV